MARWTRSRPWPAILAAVASLWGFWIVLREALDGISYPNELWEPLTLALLPAAFGLAAWLGQRVAGAVLYALYVGASVVLGFGFGGPHLVVGVPLLTIGLFLLFMGRERSPVGSARASRAPQRR